MFAGMNTLNKVRLKEVVRNVDLLHVTPKAHSNVARLIRDRGRTLIVLFACRSLLS